MRLKYVYISEYKNLKDFELRFDSDSFLDIFVGKNGTGKSNLFEALIEIFRHLSSSTSKLGALDFEYVVKYEIDGTAVKIEWKKGELTINERSRRTLGKTPLPENVLVYYSGHNKTVSNLVESYEESFKRDIKTADENASRYFFGISPNYKELLLSSILIQPNENSARRFLCQKLGIKEIGQELRMSFARPYYASDSKFNVDNDNPATRYWSPEGITKEFLERLDKCEFTQPDKGPIKTQGYQANDDKYILYFDVSKIQTEFSDLSPQEFFRHLDNLHLLEMLESISVPITLEIGKLADTSFFSDGQFQSVYIYSIIELFKDRNCLTLLDEPDSFLHPEWQHEFLSQVVEISDQQAENNHILLSSHSASTISSSDEKQIRLFEIDGGKVKVSKARKSEVINSLSSGLITFSEKEARLNIQHILSNTTGPVLFTEGITDEIILETAWKKLYPTQECPFEIQNAFDSNFISSLLRRDELYQKHPGRVFFGLFDFDEAFNKWKGFSGIEIETDPCKCLTQKHNTQESYVLLLPVPTSSTIKHQVINPSSGNTYQHNSLLTIELLFHDVPELADQFDQDAERTDQFRKFRGDKVKFAKEKVPQLSSTHFKVFEPLFDFLKTKCPQVTEQAAS